MDENIEILSANMIDNLDDLATNLSNISNENPAMLYRTKEFYADLLAQNLIVVAFDRARKAVIWSWCLLPLWQEFAEISGIHVHHEYTWKWIGNAIVRQLRTIAEQSRLQLLLTMKPGVKGSEGMIIDATRNNMVPVPFDYLTTHPEVYKNCCSCESNDPETWCRYRDKTCVLGVELNATSYQESSQHISSPIFETAVPDSTVRNRVVTAVRTAIDDFLTS